MTQPEFPKVKDGAVPDDPQEQAKMLIAAAVDASVALRRIADALRDIHAVLENRMERK
jgi:hypothetical protein